MTTINVRSVTQCIVVDPATHAINVINAGPQGPPGVGGTASSYMHTQTIVSSSWVINHGLGFKPSVDTYDTDGSSIEGHAIHHTDNQVEVQLLTPHAGTARLS